MPEIDVLVAALIAGAFGGAILLLIVGLRGVEPDPPRPPSRLHLFVERQRSPLLAIRLTAGVLLALLIGVVTHWPVAALGLGGMVALWPALTGGSRAEQTQIARLEALVSWTEALRDTTAAHAGLEQAIPATAETAPPIIRPALSRMVGHIRTRVPLEDALQDLAEQLDHAADMIIAALINNVKRRGDGLVQVLSGLAAASREELDLRRKITAGRAGDRRAVQLMLAIVLAVATFLVLFSGGSYTKPYGTVGGQLVLAIVLAMFTTSFLWIRKLAGARPPSRFLPHTGQRMGEIELRIVATLTGSGQTPAGDHVDRPVTVGGAP
jgi:Flp pilus assembly protein TadB